jgi:hypothetical protein
MTRTHAAAAAKAFEETLEEISVPGETPGLQDPQTLGRRAALLVATEAVWGEVLGPLLDAEQVRTLLKVDRREAINDLVKEGRILALEGSGGRTLYPAFLFDSSGCPYPEVAEIIAIFSGVVETPYTIASWFASPQDLLEGETPAAWMQARKNASQLLSAARRSAGELSLF